MSDQPEPREDEAVEVDVLGDLDDTAAVEPELGVAESLRNALGELRTESERIGGLGTGQEQVEAAERFAEDAGRFDEQIGSAARSAEGDRDG